MYPQNYQENPFLPSPGVTASGRQLVLIKLASGNFSYLDVTIENAGVRDLVRGFNEKGDQLRVNQDPHPEIALTGKSVAEITVDAWPGSASWSGFLCEHETLLSRLKTDHQLVESMKLQHQDLANPVIHTWNLVQAWESQSNDQAKASDKIEGFYYNNRYLSFKYQGGKGWQTSIFNDSLTGSYHVWAETGDSPFGPVFFSDLAPYYINRYQFYEGMTIYRLDPRNIALTYGLLSLQDLERYSLSFAANDALYCKDGYIPQDTLWNDFLAIISENEGNATLKAQKLHEILPETRNQLRRLCLDALKGTRFFTDELLIAELKLDNWEADTLARNALVARGETVIPKLEEAYTQSTEDSLSRWRMLNTLGKIPEFNNADLIQEALNDPSWLVQKEAEFIKMNIGPIHN